MERISRDNAVLCLIDHQLGLLSGVRDITVGELKHNVVALAKAAQILGLPVIIATTAKNEFWGPTAPELLEALKAGYASIDRMTVNAWDEPAFVEAVKATGRSHLIFAAVSLQVCAAYPAYSAIVAGYKSYVVVDASGTFSQTQRENRNGADGAAGRDLDRLPVDHSGDDAYQRGSACGQIYDALDLDFAVLAGQMSEANAARASKH
jgi:nicotinamidase-related amidase